MSEFGELEGMGAGGAAGFIRDAIEQGMGSREALDAFRGLGGSMRNEYWDTLYGTVQDTIAAEPGFVGRDYNTHLSDNEYVEWEAGRAGTYMHDVNVFIRDVGTGEIRVQRYSALGDSPMTPDEAIDEALGVMDDAADHYEERVLGATFHSAYKMTGRPR